MMNHTFVEGDLVRKRGETREFVLTDINPNPNYVADDETWADCYDDRGSIDVDSPDDLELVMPAVEQRARTLPTAAAIAAGLDLLGSGWDDVVDVDETERDSDGVVQCFGRAKNGLLVAFKVTVSEVETQNF